MLTILAGKFRMGDLNKVGDADEQPIRVVTLKAAFAVSVTEVTFAQFDVFTTAAGREPPSDEKWGRDDRPVINVTWQDANDYAGWLSEQTGHVYRLPSESEWEYVARANTETTRPWGDDANKACDHANVADLDLKGLMPKYQAPVHQCSDKNSFTAAVGSYRANGFGVSDMLGNVLEWTSDCWSASYTGAPDDRRPVDPENCKERVIRGGSWLLFPKAARSANRLKFSPQQGNKQLGIRLIRELR